MRKAVFAHLIAGLAFAASAGIAQAGQGMSPESIERMRLWADCSGYKSLMEMLARNYEGIATTKRDGRDVLAAKVAGEDFCIVTPRSSIDPQPVASCVWMKYGTEFEAWAKSTYARRAKSISACRKGVKSVFVLPQGRLHADEQSHFMRQDGSESWSVGYSKIGRTWFVEMHVYGATK